MQIVGEDLVNYKRKLVETFSVFDAFCRENDIIYFACGGTAIGTIRHQGFIPWDDDIDVAMLRKDYDRFIELKDKLSNTKYRIIDYHDDGYFLPAAKFIDASTTLWELEEQPYIMGAYLDVFPLDDVDDTPERLVSVVKKYQNIYDRLRKSKAKLKLSNTVKYLLSGHIKTFATRCFDWICIGFIKTINPNYYFHRAEREETIMRNKSGDFVLNYNTFYPISKETFPKSLFVDIMRMSFEDIEINMPIGYHQYLTQLYGDYMKLPPEEKRVGHHSCYFYDLNHRYSMDEIIKQCNHI